MMRAAILFAAMATSAAVNAQQQVISAEPETVSLTIYRDPSRGGEPIDANWPTGYALVTETRTVQIPAGESQVRFEGVAEGMFPESAIVTGLPKGVREKNRDARLLSPAGLVDAYLKRSVTLTRTDKATGKTREQAATITAGPDGGVILQTAEGFEALRCTGLPERMAYGGVPATLSAKPTLSVMTSSERGVTAKLTLTYMAAGFDWQANYVTQLSEDTDAKPGEIGKTKVQMFAWMTLANGGNQSFLNANTMAIAGTPNREDNAEPPEETAKELTIRCWPQQRTHEVPFRGQPQFYNRPGNRLDDNILGYEGGEEYIVVTAAKRREAMMDAASPVMVVDAAMIAEQEDVGDLKLYRIPEPVTVNAKGQKQVAMIVQPNAKFDRLYRVRLDEPGYIPLGESQPMWIILKTDNKAEKGLGLPLPSGQAMVFENSAFGPLLAGETALRDRAIGDKVELVVGEASDVRMAVTLKAERRYTVTLSNARGEPVNAEIEIPFELRGKPDGLRRVDGVPTWSATLPANGERSFEFTLKRPKRTR